MDSNTLLWGGADNQLVASSNHANLILGVELTATPLPQNRL